MTLALHDQELVVSRVLVPHVRTNGQVDRLPLESQHTPAGELLAAFSAGRVADELEHDDIVAGHWHRALDDPRNFMRRCSLSRWRRGKFAGV